MGSDDMEVAGEAVGGEGRGAGGEQTELEVVKEGKGIGFGPSPEMEGRDGFGDRINSEPEIAESGETTDTSDEFIQLEKGKGEVAKEMIMPGMRMGAHVLEPAAEGCLGATGEAHHDGEVDPFDQEPEDHFDLLWVGFEIVERGAEARGEDLGTRLAFETLDVAGFAIAN